MPSHQSVTAVCPWRAALMVRCNGNLEIWNLFRYRKIIRISCSLIIGTGCRLEVFSLVLDSLILDSSVGLSAGIQSAGDSVPETLWVRILHSAEEDNLSHFDSNIACLCQSIEIKNNKQKAPSYAGPSCLWSHTVIWRFYKIWSSRPSTRSDGSELPTFSWGGHGEGIPRVL